MGRLDVDAVLTELSIKQIQEWRAYEALEPFGNEWLQTALLAQLIANPNRDMEQHPEPFTVADFMPNTADVNEEADEDEAPFPTFSQIDEERVNLGEGEEPAWKRWQRNIRAYAATQTPPRPPVVNATSPQIP